MFSSAQGQAPCISIRAQLTRARLICFYLITFWLDFPWVENSFNCLQVRAVTNTFVFLSTFDPWNACIVKNNKTEWNIRKPCFIVPFPKINFKLFSCSSRFHSRICLVFFLYQNWGVIMKNGGKQSTSGRYFVPGISFQGDDNKDK